LRIIIEKNAICFGVGIIDNYKIDEVNILQATYLAMHQAISKLKLKPELLLIDGNRFKPYKKITHETIIKGDGKYIEIAAASILAKTYRDEIMEKLSLEFPVYNWQKNKGYPTIEHRRAVKEFGSCIYHRQTFQLLKPEQLSLF
jgi:ribonuclease HII